MAGWGGTIAIAALTASVAACGGASATRGDGGNGGVYVVARAEVWRVAREEIEREFGMVAVDDPLQGRLESTWRLYDQMGVTKKLGREELRPGDAGFRVTVRIREVENPTGGWSVSVRGTAAAFGRKMKPKPYPRGDAREPDWVQNKADKLAQAIHRRLRQYAAVSSRR